MNKIKLNQLWLKYYSQLGFEVIPSAPLVHPLFSTAFNMSAGLVQLDPKIRSLKKIKPQKQCLVQKCLRYFDIPRVGDQTHLSFFEMAGVFEIGEFNEIKTIQALWNFLTQTLKINPKNLWIITPIKVKIEGKTIKLKKELLNFLYSLVQKKLLIGNQKTNFWIQNGGAQLTDNIRLCGPQIEIFYGKDQNHLLEITNTILIKYYIDCHDHHELKKLVNPCTETVIGMERVAQVVEKKQNLFQTSYFTPLLEAIGRKKTTEDIKIILDHLKALAFIFSEKQILPGKKDRPRIVRILIRNLLTSCYVLKIKPVEILSSLIEAITKMYQSTYPEIRHSRSVLATILDHEKIYLKTIARAKKKAKKYLQKNQIKTIGPKEYQYFKTVFGLPKKLVNLS